MTSRYILPCIIHCSCPVYKLCQIKQRERVQGIFAIKSRKSFNEYTANSSSFSFSMNTQPILLFLSSLIMDRQWQCWSRKKATNEERGTNEAEQKKRVGARNQTNEANPMNRSLFSRLSCPRLRLLLCHRSHHQVCTEFGPRLF